ncbi:MAG: adenosylcobinamide-GDP ribazoletransferase [Lachnospiraceae bacterium]
MLKAAIIAFSTYSVIPMPRFSWDKAGMRYSLCFFPFIGVVIGVGSMLCFHIVTALTPNIAVVAMLLTVLPVLISGGIHMDGFLDTVDAKHSYQPSDVKLRILSDPHVGAFAVIYGILYIVVQFGLFHEVQGSEMPYIALGYVYSRTLSGLSVVTLQKAKKEGMAAVTAESADKHVKGILSIELILCMVLYVMLNPFMGFVCIAIGLLCFGYYRHMAYHLFGGITGDLAGWFLQMCELVLLIGIVIVTRLS